MCLRNTLDAGCRIKSVSTLPEGSSFSFESSITAFGQCYGIKSNFIMLFDLSVMFLSIV